MASKMATLSVCGFAARSRLSPPLSQSIPRFHRLNSVPQTPPKLIPDLSPNPLTFRYFVYKISTQVFPSVFFFFFFKSFRFSYLMVNTLIFFHSCNLTFIVSKWVFEIRILKSYGIYRQFKHGLNGSFLVMFCNYRLLIIMMTGLYLYIQ